MTEAIYCFNRAMELSVEGAVKTDPKTFYLAEGMLRLAMDLDERLRRIESQQKELSQN